MGDGGKPPALMAPASCLKSAVGQRVRLPRLSGRGLPCRYSASSTRSGDPHCRAAERGKLGSFTRKTTLPERYFGAFFSIFRAFFAKRTQLAFSPTHSFRDTSTFFSWVRLVETLFSIKPSRRERRDATPQASHQGEPSGRERVQSTPCQRLFR